MAFRINWKMWMKSPFGTYLDKLQALKTDEVLDSKREKFVKMKYHLKVWDIISYGSKIAWILKRLDEDIQLILTSHKKGIPDYPFGTLQYASIDLDSFILFSRILMDKIARILHAIIDCENKPRETSFNSWYKDVDKYQGDNFIEFIKLIKEAVWFKNLKDLRDDYITHSGISIGGVIIDDDISFQLLSKIRKEETVSLRDIMSLSDQLYNFVQCLNELLCKYFDILPIKVAKRTPSFLGAT